MASGSRNAEAAVAVIQANYTDLLPGASVPAHYCTVKLRESSEIGRIIVAASEMRACLS